VFPVAPSSLSDANDLQFRNVGHNVST
jgi:hypothetical protein